MNQDGSTAYKWCWYCCVRTNESHVTYAWHRSPWLCSWPLALAASSHFLTAFVPTAGVCSPGRWQQKWCHQSGLLGHKVRALHQTNGTAHGCVKKKKKMYVNAKQMDGLNHEDHSPSTKVGKEGRDLRIWVGKKNTGRVHGHTTHHFTNSFFFFFFFWFHSLLVFIFHQILVSTSWKNCLRQRPQRKSLSFVVVSLHRWGCSEESWLNKFLFLFMRSSAVSEKNQFRRDFQWP